MTTRKGDYDMIPEPPITERQIKLYKWLHRYFGVSIASTVMGFYLVFEKGDYEVM